MHAARERVQPWWGNAQALQRDRPYEVGRPNVAEARMQTFTDDEGVEHRVSIAAYAVLVRDVPDVAKERQTCVRISHLSSALSSSMSCLCCSVHCALGAKHCTLSAVYAAVQVTCQRWPASL